MLAGLVNFDSHEDLYEGTKFLNVPVMPFVLITVDHTYLHIYMLNVFLIECFFPFLKV